MFCLLCHEKVSRLRAWRTKSEFCCDEHAEVYKRQTLERLLTDQDEGQPADSPPLPVETRGVARGEGDATAEETSAADALARFEEHDAPAGGLDERLGSGKPPSLDSEDRDEGVRELWRLAEEVGPGEAGSDDDWAAGAAGLSGDASILNPNPFGGFGDGSGDVTEQSPEEALAALRELSSARSSDGATIEDSGPDIDALLAARGQDESSRAQNLTALDDLEAAEGLPASLGEALPDEDSLPPLDMGALEPLDDDELPSILDRLTESDAGEVDLQAAEAPNEIEPPPSVEQPAAGQAEQVVEEVSEEQEQPAAQTAEAAEETEELSEAGPVEDSGAFDLLEEAVDSHLEEREEKPAGQGSRKVVPFPLSRQKPGQADDRKPGESQPAAASASEAQTAKAGGRKKTGKGKSGSDLSRVNLKPVAVMFGIEPALSEPAPGAGRTPVGAAELPGQEGLAEPPMCYPAAARPHRLDGHLPVYARLYPVLPGTIETPSLAGAENPDSPAYAASFVAPPPLAAERSARPGKRSLGSERAWMVRIEPELVETSAFEVALPNGDQHSPWLSPRLPAALLAGVAFGNGSGKLDLSGSRGQYEPPVDRLCLVLPELGELGGSPKQSSSKTQGEGLKGWMPPTVLDPRFDIERPAGRDLSDFG